MKDWCSCVAPPTVSSRTSSRVHISCGVTSRRRRRNRHRADAYDIDREMALDGLLDDDQRRRLLAIANRCPVHLTLSARIEIRTTLQ